MKNICGARASTSPAEQSKNFDGHHQPAVETVFEANDRGTLGMAPRDLDGIFDGLSAAVHKESLLRKVARCQGVEPLGQPHVALVRGDVEAGVKVAVELRAHRCGHARRAMADVQAADTAGEIEEPVAVHIFEQAPSAFATKTGVMLATPRGPRPRAAASARARAGTSVVVGSCSFLVQCVLDLRFWILD